ncbi:type II secretion system major pseudopilin GspG [Pelotomaculum terephthalicicum JT]|uniref:type II secretion system major pseudopilin GspG n=1 Tax=Pelotomaculum TaxID=191373 RepID=UPI0009C4DBB8|nr:MULTISPECIES: type II secretion system major pseudopilin GspG [Pelotomaculum]MCG9968106.1 type II secretion system major pseudopilin GspG [Pelotomaculum terephthalicicum JT]OPX87863.1 MAG: Type II secretion system protein G precursor [Pelotomaculum sp. PtaB.Bin117]OPY64034.1 MAG: Type II secretion system protein G precursor [Pelotomaculum sp. PtaU1.Bin065]
MLVARALRNESGFTLMELMVVIVIIGVLAAIAVPSMVKQVDKAKVKRAMVELKAMKTAIDVYRAEKGVYPTTSQINDVLEDYGINFGSASYKDPWEKPYVYLTNDTEPSVYKLFSYGPDGLSSGGDNIVATSDANPAENTSDAEADPLDDLINSGGSAP